jgi:hypothetical protein
MPQGAVVPPRALNVRNRSDRLRLAIDRQFYRFSEPVFGGPFDTPGHVWAQEMIQRGNDADFLVFALRQFSRLADWALKGSFATDGLRDAVATYKAQIPHLVEIRDSLEHFDEYASGTGKRQLAGEVPGGYGYGVGGSITYGQFVINLGEAVSAARDLHRALRQAVDQEAEQDAHGGPETILMPNP